MFQRNPKLFSYGAIFFCSNKFPWLPATYEEVMDTGLLYIPFVKKKGAS